MYITKYKMTEDWSVNVVTFLTNVRLVQKQVQRLWNYIEDSEKKLMHTEPSGLQYIFEISNGKCILTNKQYWSTLQVDVEKQYQHFIKYATKEIFRDLVH